MLEPGAILAGRFRIDRPLGAGGMGIVVAATHLELAQPVAIKVLRDELVTIPAIVARFIREARAVAQLRTPHVCRVLDVGRLESGAPYIVMERLEGADLASVAVRGPLSPRLAVDYVIQACVALSEAHAAGIVHRDVKPANLFVTRAANGEPFVKVLDFGIAKAATAAEARLTATASQMGSPAFMSPEQIKSARDVDLRTDIWALGVTLYQLVSGRMPFAGTQLAEIAVNVTSRAPAPLGIDVGLDAVVMRCLEKEPERRYPDVATLASALLPYAGPTAVRHVAEITGAPPIPTTTTFTATSMGAQPTQLTEAPAAAERHAAPPAAPRRGAARRVAIVLGVVAIAGVAAFLGYLARGDREAPPGERREATMIPVRDAASPPVDTRSALDASPPVDASAAPDADPWLGPAAGSAVPRDAQPERAARPATPAVADATALKMMRSMLSAPQRAQMRRSLADAERMLAQLEKAQPAQYTQILISLVQTACIVESRTEAQRFLAKLPDVDARTQLIEACRELGVSLAAP